MMIERYIC